MICDANNLVEHYRKRIKFLHNCPFEGWPNRARPDRQMGLDGRALLGQPSKLNTHVQDFNYFPIMFYYIISTAYQKICRSISWNFKKRQFSGPRKQIHKNDHRSVVFWANFLLQKKRKFNYQIKFGKTSFSKNGPDLVLHVIHSFFRLVKDFSSWDDFGNMQDLFITFFQANFVWLVKDFGIT